MYRKNVNPTILSVLKENGIIIFQSGMEFRGDKENELIYIYFSTENTFDRAYTLNMNGVNESMKALREYEDFLET